MEMRLGKYFQDFAEMNLLFVCQTEFICTRKSANESELSIRPLKILLKGTSKNYHRHAELVSESPYLHEIAYQFRNDESQKTEFLEVPFSTNGITTNH